jgi:hypothetical protein
LQKVLKQDSAQKARDARRLNQLKSKAQRAIVINPFQLQAFSTYATPQIVFFSGIITQLTGLCNPF